MRIISKYKYQGVGGIFGGAINEGFLALKDGGAYIQRDLFL